MRQVWSDKNAKLNIYRLDAANYLTIQSNRYFPDILLQDVLDRGFETAQTQDAGAALGELLLSIHGG